MIVGSTRSNVWKDICHDYYPENAMVRLRDGSQKQIMHINIGDEVQTGHHAYEKVLNWLRRDMDNVDTPMIMVSAVTNVTYQSYRRYSITASADHFMRTRYGVKMMNDVTTDDYVITNNNEYIKVSRIEHVLVDGLYAPYTKSGNIIMNDILLSIYVELFPSDNLCRFDGKTVRWRMECIVSHGCFCVCMSL